MISKWLEMAFSARSAAMLAPYDLVWPQDLLEDFMAGQRAAPGAAAVRVAAGSGRATVGPGSSAPSTGSNVIPLRQRSRRG